jgi:hypothetical protein
MCVLQQRPSTEKVLQCRSQRRAGAAAMTATADPAIFSRAGSFPMLTAFI